MSGAARLNGDAYLAAARARLNPGDRIASVTASDGRGPVVVAASPAARPGDRPRPGPPPRTLVYLDPPTGRVLAVASSGSGPVRFLHVLHGSLQLPGVGRPIVGWIGVAMMVSSFTGLWLWWPTVGRWARGLRWRRHRNTDTNLHYLAGFWIALPLFVLSLTGAWISFPAFFGRLTGEAGAEPGRMAVMRAMPVARPSLDMDEAIARARGVIKGRWTGVTFPTERSADWTVTFGRGKIVKVADDRGTAVLAAESGGIGGNRPGIAGLMRRIHDGEGMGPVWQVIIFLGGIAPALLAVTGVIMWWRARRWKAELAARQRGRVG